MPVSECVQLQGAQQCMGGESHLVSGVHRISMENAQDFVDKLVNAPHGLHLVGRKEYKLIYPMNQCMNEMVILFTIGVNVKLFAGLGRAWSPGTSR